MPFRRPRDIQLEPEAREELVIAIAQMYDNEEAARSLLRSVGVPVGAIPAWIPGTDAERYWDQVFADLEAGRVSLEAGRRPEPFRRLLELAATTYNGNERLHDLYAHHINPGLMFEDEDEAWDNCRVIVQAETDEERTAALEILRRLNLDPREELSTWLVTLFSVSSSDQGMVRALLKNTGLGWTVTSADGARSLLYALYGPGNLREESDSGILTDVEVAKAIAKPTSLAGHAFISYVHEDSSQVSKLQRILRGASF